MFDLPAADAIEHEMPGLSVARRLADTEPIAAALPKDSTNAEAVGAALRAMDADGTIDRPGGALARELAPRQRRQHPLLRTDQT